MDFSKNLDGCIERRRGGCGWGRKGYWRHGIGDIVCNHVYGFRRGGRGRGKEGTSFL